MLTTTPNVATSPEISREIHALRAEVQEMRTQLATLTTFEDRQEAKRGIESAQRRISRLERELCQPGFERRS